MMSGSPAWKPQATLTEVARSIMAASLPISHAPNPSPRSQLRSIVVMMATRLREWLVWSVLCCYRCDLPGCRVDGADRAARDISILQRFDVELKILDVAQLIGQGC